MEWSKNVGDERECPDQILMGSHNDMYYIMIALSLHLELFLKIDPDSKYLFTSQLDENARRD